MFDIAFSELIVVAIVALVVIGPEKLPKVARTLGHLWGRAQRYVNDVKAEISSEMPLEQLQELQKLQDEIRLNIQDTGSTQFQVGQVIKHDMQQAAPTKYQVGQVINHEIPQNDNTTPQELPSTPIADTPELKQGSKH